MTAADESSTEAGTIPLHAAREGRTFARKDATTADQLPGIIDTARETQAAWADLDIRHRAGYLMDVLRHLHRHSSDYSERLSLLNGKPFTEALIGEIYPTLSTFRFFCRKGYAALRPRRIALGAMPMAYSRLEFDPLGVVGVISPWNYPFKLMLQDVPAALIAGNAVVIKVSEHAAAVGDLVEELLVASKLPEGLVQFVHGDGEIGSALISAGIDKVVFTGSSATGRKVYAAAAEAMIPATLEMGGKDSAIILEDADLDDAARGIVWGAITNCGQACASIETIHCPEYLHEEFTARCARLVGTLPVGSLGTMNTVFQKEKVVSQVEEALSGGATIVAQAPMRPTENAFALPAVVLEGVPPDSALQQEETFGPVVVIQPYGDVEDVIREINDGPYGLTASIWTTNHARARELASRIDTGVVTINDHLITPGFPEAPWVGRKASGLGFSMSTMSLVGFSRMRYVYDDRGLVKYKFWRYPYDKAKRAWLRLFMDGQIASNPLVRAISFLRTLPAMVLRRNFRWDDRPG